MSKLEEKFLKEYSLNTLRDVSITSLTNDDIIVYNSTNQKFENKKQTRFGTDFAEITKSVPNGQDFTGNQFQTFDTLTFNVSGPDLLNKFRINSDFVWSHNAASNDARFRVLLDGSVIGSELRIEPKDAGNDQRFQNNILRYVTDLSIGNHTVELQCRPATASRITQLYYSTLETWRVE